MTVTVDPGSQGVVTVSGSRWHPVAQPSWMLACRVLLCGMRAPVSFPFRFDHAPVNGDAGGASHPSHRLRRETEAILITVNGFL